MVRLPLLASILALGGALAGCPDDVGQGIHHEQGLIAPRSFQGWATSGLEVDLMWEDRATSEAGYRLEVSGGPFSMGLPVTTYFLPADSTQFAYSSLPDRTYYFRLYAITATMQSDPSEEISVVTPAIVPGTPAIVAISADWSSVIVQWTDVDGETGYQIELSQDDFTWTPLAPMIPADTDRAGFVPAPGVKYYWVRIYAIGPYANSPRSDAWYVAIPPKP